MDSRAWLPRLTVATIIERDGRFLLVEEYADGEELVYNQPAGHLDEHETLAAAAIRETLEETAWEVQVSAIVGVLPGRRCITTPINRWMMALNGRCG